MKFGRMRPGHRNFLHSGNEWIRKIDQLLPLGCDGECAYREISSASGKSCKHLVARDQNKHDVKTEIFRFRLIFVVDPIFEGLQILVGASMLNPVDDVILSFGRRDERS